MNVRLNVRNFYRNVEYAIVVRIGAKGEGEFSRIHRTTVYQSSISNPSASARSLPSRGTLF